MGGETFDIIVIGGGISGLGVADLASAQGFRVLLLEKDRCAEATSKNSLRIIHGGFRYLQSLDFRRVLESLKDQRELLADFPEFIKPLRCVMPLARFGFKSKWPVKAALALYERCYRKCGGKAYDGGILSQAEVESQIEILRGLAPFGALEWQDAYVTDPIKFAARLKKKIKKQGGIVSEGVTAGEITFAADTFRVETRGGVETEVCARFVVNAAGPWVKRVLWDGGGARQIEPRWCKAYNLILKKQLEPKFAVGIHGAERLFFIVPRGEKTAIGTWYVAFEGSPDGASVAERDVSDFIRAFSETMPTVSLAREDVEDVELGIVPMKEFREGNPRFYGLSPISRQGNYIEILSTKYTTFRSQARRVMYFGRPLIPASPPHSLWEH